MTDGLRRNGLDQSGAESPLFGTQGRNGTVRAICLRTPCALRRPGEGPSGEGGGTADTVLEAREAGLPVVVVWPDGAAREG